MARLWRLEAETSCVEVFVDEASEFRHRVGGASSRLGLIPIRGVSPIHLVMTLDLTDPRVPFPQPGVSELPLFFPFEYDGSRLSYRIVDDNSIEITEQPERDAVVGFPFEDYPRIFPCIPIALSQRIRIDEYFKDSFIQAQWEDELNCAASERRAIDDIDRIALIEGLMQGPPRTLCRNPACDRQPMSLLTVLRGDLISGFNFWSNDDYGPDVDVTYEYCPGCYTIHTQNQCG
jgi:hypothetical protein